MDLDKDTQAYLLKILTIGVLHLLWAAGFSALLRDSTDYALEAYFVGAGIICSGIVVYRIWILNLDLDLVDRDDDHFFWPEDSK